MSTSFPIAAAALTFFLFLGNIHAADWGNRYEARLDNRGDRIENRLDRRGDRIDNRLDRRGQRVDRRYDRRHS